MKRRVLGGGLSDGRCPLLVKGGSRLPLALMKEGPRNADKTGKTGDADKTDKTGKAGKSWCEAGEAGEAWCDDECWTAEGLAVSFGHFKVNRLYIPGERKPTLKCMPRVYA